MLTFQLNEQGVGFFAPADEAKGNLQIEKIRKIVTDMGEGIISPRKGEKALEAMIAKDPYFLRGYALLAELYADSERENGEELAAELYIKGYEKAMTILPPDFSGPLDMETVTVQCFMRCCIGYFVSLLEKDDYEGALEAVQRLLLFDPEDTFNCGREVADLLIMAGRTKEATELLQAECQERHTAYYSLAYVAFVEEDYPRAALELRRACLLAPYTVMALSGGFMLPNIFWEDGPEPPSYSENMQFTELLGGQLWNSNEDAYAFLQWLSQSSLVFKERAEFLALSEKCFEAELDDYEKVLDESISDFSELWKTIDLESSTKLVSKTKEMEDGQELYPWQVLAWHRDYIMSEENDDDDENGCCSGHAH